MDTNLPGFSEERKRGSYMRRSSEQETALLSQTDGSCLQNVLKANEPFQLYGWYFRMKGKYPNKRPKRDANHVFFTGIVHADS